MFVARVALLLCAIAVSWNAAPADAFACGKCKQADCCGPICSYQPCIKYVDKTHCCNCCSDAVKIETVLQVKDPCTCCLVDVPVCLPACCSGAPCVDTKCGALDNSKTFYTWPSGYEVKVVANKRGVITVVYLGK